MAIEPIEPLVKTGYLRRRLRWVCFFLFVGGMALLANSGKTCMRAWQARNWQSAPCSIDQSGIKSSLKPGHHAIYTFFVTYHYTYQAQDYRSTSGTLDPESEMDLKAAGALSNRFPAGSHATCYLDPQRPADSVLDRSVTKRELSMTSFGVVLIVGSLAGLTATRKRR